MFETIGACASCREIGVYWRDASKRSRHNVIGKHKRAHLLAFSANLAAQVYRESLESGLLERCKAHQPRHFQIGRAYPYSTRIAGPALSLIKANKAKLDRQGIMNSRVFGS
jgi:glycolate oxidase